MKHAFSLVELAIVLVILGLLTGGILTGQSLIRAAELRAVTTEYQNYQTAVITFRDKYFAIPGDMRNATAFWGAADTSGTGGECGDSLNDTGTGTETCNGDGNGALGNPERFRFWQHLANAELLEGSFTGNDATAVGHSPGLNVPASKISSSGWHNSFAGSQSANGEFFDGSYGHVFYFGQYDGSTIHGAALTPEEAWNTDTKMDDGLPGSGRVRVFKDSGSLNPNCADGDTNTAEYELSLSGALCSFVFANSF